MPETEGHKLRFPEGKDPATLATYFEHLAKDVDAALDALAPKQIVGVAKKQLLIANAAGVVTAVTASGDVTNDESGVFAIGGEKVTTGKLADKAVTTAKVDDGAVTSGKAKLTAGQVVATSTLKLEKGAGYKDVPGATLEITPSVASTLLVIATFELMVEEVESIAEGALVSDGKTFKSAIWGPKTSGAFASVSQSYAVSLTAAPHTIKLQARSSGGLSYCFVGATGFLYELIAS
jgi:hypothetical protein